MRGSTYLFDQQIARFFSTLDPIPDTEKEIGMTDMTSGGDGVSEPFVASLRTRRKLRFAWARPASGALTIRVEVPERWDVALLVGRTHRERARGKARGAARGVCRMSDASDYVIKLRGFEVLDENVSLADAGARNGSIFLLTHRRRRPVR